MFSSNGRTLIVRHTTAEVVQTLPGRRQLNSAIVGGEASFKALMAWAAQNLTAEQLEGLKQILKSGDMAKIKEVLLALQKAFVESQSYENYRLF